MLSAVALLLASLGTIALATGDADVPTHREPHAERDQGKPRVEEKDIERHYSKAHGHEHARLCDKPRCYEYCDRAEQRSAGLRRLRTAECREDCMSDCDRH
jgi:hypothetical protein